MLSIPRVPHKFILILITSAFACGTSARAQDTGAGGMVIKESELSETVYNGVLGFKAMQQGGLRYAAQLDYLNSSTARADYALHGGTEGVVRRAYEIGNQADAVEKFLANPGASPLGWQKDVAMTAKLVQGLIVAGATVETGPYGGAAAKVGTDVLVDEFNSFVQNKTGWGERVENLQRFKQVVNQLRDRLEDRIPGIVNNLTHGKHPETSRWFSLVFDTQLGITRQSSPQKIYQVHPEFQQSQLNKATYDLVGKLQSDGQGQLHVSDKQLKEYTGQVQATFVEWGQQIRTDLKGVKEVTDKTHAGVTILVDRAMEEAKAAQFREGLRGAEAGVSVVTSLVGRKDPQLARRMQAVGSGTIKLVAATHALREGLTGQNSPLRNLNTTAIFTGDLVSVGLSLIMAFAATGPTPEQMILEGINDLKDMVADLQKVMNERFDSIDLRLAYMNAQMDQNFDRLMALAQGTQLDSAEIKRQLGNLGQTVRQSELEILRVVRSEMAQLKSAQLEKCLSFRDNVQGMALDPRGFADCILEAHNSGVRLAPADEGIDFTRANSEPAYLSRRLDRALGSNLVFFAQWLQQLSSIKTDEAPAIGIDFLNFGPVADIGEWQVNADAVLDLSRQWPQYLRHIKPNLVEAFLARGRTFDELSRALTRDENNDASNRPKLYEKLLGDFSELKRQHVTALEASAREFNQRQGLPPATNPYLGAHADFENSAIPDVIPECVGGSNLAQPRSYSTFNPDHSVSEPVHFSVPKPKNFENSIPAEVWQAKSWGVASVEFCVSGVNWENVKQSLKIFAGTSKGKGNDDLDKQSNKVEILQNPYVVDVGVTKTLTSAVLTGFWQFVNYFEGDLFVTIDARVKKGTKTLVYSWKIPYTDIGGKKFNPHMRTMSKHDCRIIAKPRQQGTQQIVDNVVLCKFFHDLGQKRLLDLAEVFARPRDKLGVGEAIPLFAAPAMAPLSAWNLEQLHAAATLFSTRVQGQLTDPLSAVGATAARIIGQRKLIEAAVTFGMPTTLQRDDRLQSLLYGRDALYDPSRFDRSKDFSGDYFSRIVEMRTQERANEDGTERLRAFFTEYFAQSPLPPERLPKLRYTMERLGELRDIANDFANVDARPDAAPVVQPR